MEGRSGVILTTASNADASQAETWRSKRTPSAVESGAADHAVCFRISSGYDFGGVSHVTIYETRSDDVAAAEERVGAAAGETTESLVGEVGLRRAQVHGAAQRGAWRTRRLTI